MPRVAQERQVQARWERRQTRLRLAGPERKAASKAAAKLLKKKRITLECGKRCKKDRYGRLLRYVRMEDGRDFGLEMIRMGLCEDFGFKYPHVRGREYLRVQEQAKMAGRGVWAVSK